MGTGVRKTGACKGKKGKQRRVRGKHVIKKGRVGEMEREGVSRVQKVEKVQKRREILFGKMYYLRGGAGQSESLVS